MRLNKHKLFIVKHATLFADWHSWEKKNEYFVWNSINATMPWSNCRQKLTFSIQQFQTRASSLNVLNAIKFDFFQSWPHLRRKDVIFLSKIIFSFKFLFPFLGHQIRHAVSNFDSISFVHIWRYLRPIFARNVTSKVAGLDGRGTIIWCRSGRCNIRFWN